MRYKLPSIENDVKKLLKIDRLLRFISVLVIIIFSAYMSVRLYGLYSIAGHHLDPEDPILKHSILDYKVFKNIFLIILLLTIFPLFAYIDIKLFRLKQYKKIIMYVIKWFLILLFLSLSWTIASFIADLIMVSKIFLEIKSEKGL